MLTAKSSIAEEAAAHQEGKILIATVDTPHGGRP
jgi:hypothetical protein